MRTTPWAWKRTCPAFWMAMTSVRPPPPRQRAVRRGAPSLRESQPSLTHSPSPKNQCKSTLSPHRLQARLSSLEKARATAPGWLQMSRQPFPIAVHPIPSQLAPLSLTEWSRAGVVVTNVWTKTWAKFPRKPVMTQRRQDSKVVH